MQTIPDLVRGVGATFAFGAHDHHSGRRDSRGPCQAEHLPPTHAPRLVAVQREAISSIGLDDAVELTRTGDLWLFRGHTGADRAIRG